MTAESGPKTEFVLRDDGGQFWQLMEVGLGWARHAEIGAEWFRYPALTPHLPAAIVSRPRGAKSWNYKLHVRGDVMIGVHRGDDGVIRFGVERGRRRLPR